MPVSSHYSLAVRSAALVGDLDERARTRVKEWLSGSGTTQTALADAIGRNQAWMSRYLDGEFDTDLDTLTKLASAFQHSLFELLDLSATDEERALLRFFRALKPETRALAIQVLEQWAGAPRPRARTRAKRGALATDHAQEETGRAREGETLRKSK